MDPNLVTEIPINYAKAKEEEFLSWHNQVSQWELTTYLTHF